MDFLHRTGSLATTLILGLVLTGGLVAGAAPVAAEQQVRCKPGLVATRDGCRPHTARHDSDRHSDKRPDHRPHGDREKHQRPKSDWKFRSDRREASWPDQPAEPARPGRPPDAAHGPKLRPGDRLPYRPQFLRDYERYDLRKPKHGRHYAVIGGYIYEISRDGLTVMDRVRPLR